MNLWIGQNINFKSKEMTFQPKNVPDFGSERENVDEITKLSKSIVSKCARGSTFSFNDDDIFARIKFDTSSTG